ncbi:MULTISPECIES: trypsin-like serine protease [Rhizobium/Agrobacterium group]|uniref:trypsin-like serine protease n=1 Tax=Rhizobium/Agrobacterium group TaxID=227290 RepID=UPI0005700B98|nr:MULTISPECIES: trypsin-like serine protease [Rhizobium/Agrobacterium group]AKC10464.1 hypothetical protein Ach5_46950 [Agrobacterium tumefaciens]AYM19612.1 hypothetical protein At15955_46270 [Agrobacterium tumefaciens]AYM70913.1 hypothetical protein AtA6_46970 [Agrobacterium tumefaciens]NIB59530.1 S1 family peptidase [Agrobacterium tumefaciens]NSZ24981.1 S1 family peptidase [Agrobacterium tumefaciens]
MLRSLLLALLYLVASTAQAERLKSGEWPANVPGPQLSGGVGAEVVGGAPSPERRVVAITYTSNAGKRMLCSGLWISFRFVVTAAHCTCEGQDFMVTNESPLITSGAGPTPWVGAKLTSRYSSAVCRGEAPLGGDLALLTLQGDLQIDPGQRTCSAYTSLDSVPLLSAIANARSEVTISGYGFDGGRAGSSGIRREARARMNTPYCTERMAQWLGCAPLREFIAGAGGSRADTCASDSGAPVFRRSGDNEFVAVGIVSRALPVSQLYGPPGYCGSGGIYTTLGRKSVLSWLRANGVAQNGSCGPATR